jgi:hypothetical protein
VAGRLSGAGCRIKRRPAQRTARPIANMGGRFHCLTSATRVGVPYLIVANRVASSGLPREEVGARAETGFGKRVARR